MQYLTQIFLFITGFLTLLLLFCIGMCELHLYSSLYEDEYFGQQWVVFIMLCNITLQVLVHIILFITNTFNYFSSKNVVYLHTTFVFLFALTTAIFWGVVNYFYLKILKKNEQKTNSF
jgi:hypothetical protein